MSYRFARSPKWLAGHALAAIAVIVFVQLGFWQVRRLDDRRDFNRTLETRFEDGFVSLATLVARHGADPESLELRPVVATGVYALDEEVIVQGRSRLGLSGHHVATPLVLADGRAIVVDRGWVPIDIEGPPVIGAEPPGAVVTVSGLLRKSQTRGRFGPTDPPSGVLERVARVDIARLEQQSRFELLDVYVELEAQTPPQPGPLPASLAPPAVSEGPHLSYAVQWFIFAGVVVVAYPILLRRTARDGQRLDEA